MAIHWGGKGPGHVSRWPRGVGAISPYSGATMLLDFLNPVLDPRITFSRGTNATLIDSTGRLTYAPNNLVTQSQDFTVWGATAASVTANVGVAPDGTTTADLVTANGASSSHTIAFSATAGISRIFSVYLKAGTNNFAQLYFSGDGAPFANFNLATGTVGTVGSNQTATIESVGNGWYRCAIFTNSTTAGNLIIGIISSATVARAEVNSLTTSILVWGAQLEQVTYQTTPSAYNATTASAYYAPRFDYDPVTLAPRGLLIEEARTNLLLHSADFTNAAYVNSNVTVTANATAAPDGTTTADLLTAAATASVSLQQSSVVAATSATYSIFAKQGSGATQANSFRLRNTTTATTLVEITINYSTGAITYVTGSTGAAAINFGNGWWRITLTATTGITSGDTIRCDQCFLGPSTIGHNAYVWGAQLEAGSFATSYIPTVASTVTRNADVATMTGTNFSSWYNQSEGAWATEFASYVVPGGIVAQISAATNSDRFQLLSDSTGQIAVTTGGVGQGVIDAGTVVAGVPNKLAYAYKVNDTAASLAGGAAVTDITVTLPVVDRLCIGATVSPANYLNGHIRTIAYFNTRLPNAQLQTLTAPSLATTLSLDFTTGSYNVGF